MEQTGESHGASWGSSSRLPETTGAVGLRERFLRAFVLLALAVFLALLAVAVVSRVGPTMTSLLIDAESLAKYRLTDMQQTR